MKLDEEAALGFVYWGYGGTLCHPRRVQEFAAGELRRTGEAPTLVMAETRSAYRSRTIGRNRWYSQDRQAFARFPRQVVMVGCSSALVCERLVCQPSWIDLNQYEVAGGLRSGAPLGDFIRYQINKACASRISGSNDRRRITSIVATAKLVYPFAVYLR